MAIRKTTHVLKNSDIVNRPLPSLLKAGEPIINTADGIMYVSGVTTSTNEWTPAGTGTTANYFEVGSNLYDLRLRNQITEYQDIGGAGLIGKFLSGTTTGFVLADIADIAGSTDSYVTGGTFNDITDTLTLNLNLGKPSVSITGLTSAVATGLTWTPNILTVGSSDGSSVSTEISSFSALTINGPLDVTGTTTLADINAVGNFNITGNTVTNGDSTVNGTLTVTGDTLLGNTTASTIDASTIFSGGTDLASLISSNDTYATGYTYTPATNTFDITGNNAFTPLSASISSLSGLTLSNLTAGRVVYVGAGGLLTDEAGFTYNDTTNTFSTPVDGTVNVGTGGLNVDGDTVIQGDLVVLGQAISAFTNELYVEDPNVTLNYNPTGSTIATSIGAGFSVQDGNGIASGDVNLDIRRMDTLTGLTATEIPDITEYTAGTGYENRGWVTQLNDIVIRSSDITTPDGVRVLAEFDCLDGGTY